LIERTLGDYVRILRARSGWILVPLLLSLALAALYTAHTQQTYRSSTKLYVGLGASGLGDVASGIAADSLAQRRVASYADLINGSRISDPVEARFGVRPEIKAEVVTDTALISVSVVDTSPVRARDIAELVGNAFIRLQASLEGPLAGKSSLPVTIVEPASLPTEPLQPPLSVNLAVGLVFGLLAGVGVALLRDSLDSTLRTARKLETAFGLPLLGAVEATRQLKRDSVPVLDDPLSSVSEAIRQMRANIEFLAREHGQRLLVVTSALGEEGKTSMSVNLAVALAMAEHRVVLVDADLRRPSVADYLGMEPSHGLAELLAADGRVKDFLHSWPEIGLEVLPGGEPLVNSSEMLGSSRMRHLVETLGARADFVIFDAPPLLPLSDAAVLCGLTDGAVVVVRSGRTTSVQLEAALERLNAVGSAALGVVLNFMRKGGPAGRPHHPRHPRQRRRRGARWGPRPIAPLEPHVVDIDGEERRKAGTAMPTSGARVVGPRHRGRLVRPDSDATPSDGAPSTQQLSQEH
jgi:succinoglycan biosynthesis transport protein ExoP